MADHVAAHLADDLSTANRAGVAGGRYVRRAQVQAAATMPTSTTRPGATIARRCGFRSSEALRPGFVTTYGVSRAHYRDAQSASRPLA